MAKDWDVLIERVSVEAGGQTLTFRKRGVGKIFEDGASNPLLLDLIEGLADAQRAAGKQGGKPMDLLKQALSKIAGGKETTEGKIVRDLVKVTPTFLINLLVEDTVLDDPAEEPGYRRWLVSLGPTQLFDVVSGWMQVNLPEFHDPFVKGAAKILTHLNKGWTGLVQTVEVAHSDPAKAA